MATTMPGSRWGMGFLLAVGAAIAGCTSVTGTDNTIGPANTPVVGVTAQGVGFSVRASDFSFEETYAAPTEGDSLVVGLAVLGYGGGTALLEITDSTGAMLHQQTVSQSIAQGQTTTGGTPPYQVHLRFSGFTGTFVLGVGVQAS
jgi:hypothetical protein